ncbi:MAG: hypothetical protein LUG57_06965 [Oscillospiraceae bacterium]|nr:hypothetical protein [Oscillospiraceae bacterium]
MLYVMKSNVLYGERGQKPLGKIKDALFGPRKTVSRPDSAVTLKADILQEEQTPSQRRDVREMKYVLTDDSGQALASAVPGYSQREDPSVMGWPAFRGPEVDHAAILVGDKRYLLTRQGADDYLLTDERGAVLRAQRKSMSSAWNIESDAGFPAEIICGLYIFCRYIEHENEAIAA